MADITISGNVSTNNDVTLLGSVSLDNALTLSGSIEAEIIIGYTKWGRVRGDMNDQEDLTEAFNERDANLAAHISDTNNPHQVTKAQVGLGNVDNTSDANKPISSATQAALNLKANADSVYTKTEADAKFLTEHQSLAEYRKSADQDVIDNSMSSRITTNTNDINTLKTTKQNTISDLDTIRSNATAGKSASDTIATYGNIVTHNASEFEPADSTILKQEDIIDGTSSTSTINPLSANQGKLLNDRLNNVEARGRFLSDWNATTGLPVTFPETIPYAYKTGDWYVVGEVATGYTHTVTGGATTNYRPTGTSYTGVASTVVETEELKTGQVYHFDGTTWILQPAGSDVPVVDVQAEGTTVLNASTGIANVTRSSLGLGNIATHNTDEFATSSQGALADSAIQPNDNISQLYNDVGYTTTDWHDSTKESLGKITINSVEYTASKHTLSWTNNGTTYSYEVVTV